MNYWVVFVWGEKLGWPRTLFIILLFCNGIIVVKFYGFLCLVSRPFLYATGRFYLKYSISVAFLKGKESWAC